MNVDLLIDETSYGLVGSSVNRTFTCTREQHWVDTLTNEVIGSVACAEVPKDGTSCLH